MKVLINFTLFLIIPLLPIINGHNFDMTNPTTREKFRQYFCSKAIGCQVKEFDPLACGFDEALNEMNVFDTLCTMYRVNCRGRGVFTEINLEFCKMQNEFFKQDESVTFAWTHVINDTKDDDKDVLRSGPLDNGENKQGLFSLDPSNKQELFSLGPFNEQELFTVGPRNKQGLYKYSLGPPKEQERLRMGPKRGGRVLSNTPDESLFTIYTAPPRHHLRSRHPSTEKLKKAPYILPFFK